MPQKICPSCQKPSGVRTKKCVCGHVFISATPDSSMLSAESLTGDTAKKLVVKPIVQDDPPRRNLHLNRGIVVAPAGECPIKPKGYKQGWPDGPATDEIVQTWAMDVFNRYDGRFSTEAVIYWARNFWDINGAEFRRIRSLIFEILSPETPETESNEIVC